VHLKYFQLSVFIGIIVTGCEPDVDQPEHDAADRVLLNGFVYTVDSERSVAEAVALRDGHIVFVGSNEDVESLVGENTEVTDLSGQMLLPGFHDSHTHILIGDAADQECDLMNLESVNEVEAKLLECTKLPGLGDEKWIIGSGWAAWLWPKSEPDKAILDVLFPDRPVILGSSFGHTLWVNTRALEIAGIHAETHVGEDGVIVRDPETGEATGALHDSAMLLFQDIVPTFSLEYEQERIQVTMDMAHRLGVTAVIEPGMDEALMQPLLALNDAGKFKLRAITSLSPINWQSGAFDDGVYEFLAGREQWRRPNIDVDSVKIYMDGVIESGTGALLEPYEESSLGLGPRYYTQAKLNEYVTRFDAIGLQVHIHAIGDAAVRMALDAYETARDTNGATGNRHHMTHLQLIHEDDVPRFAELDIGATFQTLWAYPDPAAIDLDIPMIGEKRTWQMYQLASVQRAGGRINGASDYFVTSMNPLLAMEVGITRQDPFSNGGPVLNESERVDLATMIEAYTINGAYTMKLDHKQGSVEVGKRADLVVLNRNLFDIDPYEISDAYVTMTIFDGQTLYQRTE
jgi:predicted amidohydrolase YtcJ